MFRFFKKQKAIEVVQNETKKGFESVKEDIVSISNWIKHLDSEKKSHKNEISIIKEDLSSVKADLEEIKKVVSIALNLNFNKPQQAFFKTTLPLSNKQTGVFPVQTAVQTAVQTPSFRDFSVTERAILLLLFNTDMKLSYEDLAAMLNKEKSTIRGQINSIKSKSEGLIKEFVEKNSKKRFYVDEIMKEKILKKQKVRLKAKGEEVKKE